MLNSFLTTCASRGLKKSRARTKWPGLLTALKELIERVGEIPRMRLEAELTPVLITAHKQLDWARLLFEEAGEQARAVAAWELEQKVYRLLNDL